MSHLNSGEGAVDAIKVLLVDDEPDQMEMTRLSLRRVDPLLDVTSVEKPRDALSLLGSGDFECVVSDYQMPGMDGIEFCSEARKVSDAPLIIYTGRGSEEVASKAFAAGVDDYVRKEETLGHYQVLAKRIRHAVARKRAENSLRLTEQRDRELLDSIGDGFLALDRNYRFTYLNEKAANNVGYEPKDLIGKNIWETFPKIRGTQQEAAYRETMEKREIRRFRAAGVVADEVYDFAVYPSPEGISIFWSDVTDEKLGEEELAKRSDLRRSGIDLIGNVPWGTHFCQFYKSKDDLVDTLVPYFKAGLEGNEYCMWVTAEPLLVEEARKAMDTVIPDFNKYLGKGQIEIISYKDWYVKGDGFDSDRVLKGWIDKLEAAQRKGFSGLRLTGNTFWLEKEQWNAFTGYEAAINGVIGKYNMIALCTYSLDRCNAGEILDVVKNHQFALIKRQGVWELIESAEQAKAEAALRVSEERYRKIIETANEGIVIGAPDGSLTFVNKRFAEMLGYPVGEIIGKSVLDFVDESERQRIREARSSLGRGGVSQEEYRFRRRDGSDLWTLAGSSPLYDATGKHIGNLAMHSDITRRKLDEQTLLQVKLEWERTFDTVPDLIAVLDSEHHIQRANRSMANALGTTTDKCAGLTCYECVHGASAPPGFCPHSKTLLDGLQHVAEVYEPRLGGHFIVSTTPMKDGLGHVVGSVHVARNITERKKAEERLSRTNEELKAKNASLVEKTAEIEALNRRLVASNDELKAANDAISKSEEELASTVEELRVTNEHLSTSEEALAASNEELRSSNEELHSLNTELEEANRDLSDTRLKLQEYANEMEALVDERTREIREVKERLESFMNSATDGFTLWDPNLNLVDANVAWLRRMPNGPTIDELRGRNMTELYLGVGETGNIEKYREVLRTGLPFETLLRPLHKNFGERFYSITAFKVGDGLGIISRDFTEQKRLEEELTRASRYTRNLIEASLDPLVTISAEGKITDVNAATEAATGVPRDELIGTDFSDYFTEPEKARTGYEKVFSEGSVRDYPLAIKHRGGGVMEVLYNATVYRNEAGEPQGVFAAARDVTAMNRIQREAKLSQERLRAFMESAIDGFSIWDSDLRLLDANEAWMRRWPEHFRKEDLIGRRLEELYPGVEASPRYEEYKRVRETGVPYSFEDILSGPYVKKRIFSGRVFRVGDGLGMVSVDVTETRGMEERLRAAQRGEDIDRLAAMVAHDVRNPLTTAAQALEMARAAPANAESLHAMAEKSIVRAIKMLEELRENTRTIKPRVAVVNLRLLVEDTVRELPMPEGVAVDSDFAGSLEAVRVDPAILRRVLENLLGNAAEAMPNGGRVRVRAWEAGGEALLSVSDTGVGIPEEATRMIFTPLYTTKAKGVGLGLSFCRRAVEAHGGTIGFTSKPGEGTTFTVRLPQVGAAGT